MNDAIYRTLDAFGPWILAWLALPSLWTLAKTALRAAGREVSMSEHTIVTELPGLPLMLLHTVGFLLALWYRDPLSALLFAWWGPGYLATVALVLSKRPVDWRPAAPWTSYGCKLSYVAFMALYAVHGCWTLPFAFSVWIMSDQVRLAWFTGNADRTRRTCEDLWLPRVFYPGLLLLPLFVALPRVPAVPAAALGLSILAAWVAGLVRVARAGTFWRQPDPSVSHNLRDIVYLRRPGKTRGVGEAVEVAAAAAIAAAPLA
ncbi:MAG: hypothetical protein AB7N76_06575 [Planctomycetota bacterium]